MPAVEAAIGLVRGPGRQAGRLASGVVPRGAVDLHTLARRAPMPEHRLPSPHGGHPVDLRVDADRAAELKAASATWPSWTLTPVQIADLELLATGAYAPLTGFVTETEQASILNQGRLPDGTLWPVPITLDVDPGTANELTGERGDRGDDTSGRTPSDDDGQRAATGAGKDAGPRMLALRDAEGTMLAAMSVTSQWRPNRHSETLRLLGSDDPEHPEVAAMLRRTGAVRLGGPVEVLELPAHHDLTDVRATPAQVRERLAAHEGRAVLAVHLRGIPTSAQVAAIVTAAADLDAVVLLHPTVGPTEAHDIGRFTRIRLARLVAEHLQAQDIEVELAAVPLPARLAGPASAVQHAIVRQNHGATHLLVGPWHASPHDTEHVPTLVGPHAPQERLEAVADELEIVPVMIRAEQVATRPEMRADPHGDDPTRRQLLATRFGTFPDPSAEVPDDIARVILERHPARDARGLTVFLTGLSGSGKSTIAKVLRGRLLEDSGRTVTLLDGDLVRRHLSSELGFSKRDRDLNVRRIGYVASEISKHGGIAICAPIAPYDESRRACRDLVQGNGGGFVLVHVSTPLEVCEARDRKGLYAKARAGEITGFTGIDDPYEEPADAALTLDTTDITPEQAAEQILAHLDEQGWWPPRS